jgi:hypothetical protein
MKTFLYPKVLRGYQPLLYSGRQLFAAKGNSLYEFDASLHNRGLHSSFFPGRIKSILIKNGLYTRIFREGFHGLAIDDEQNMVAVVRKQLLLKRANEKVFRAVFKGFRGSRPLRLEYSQGLFCFGEYFGNDNREAVSVFTSKDGEVWEKGFTFSAGTIRHVHGILDDPKRKGSWLFSGDSDEESKIWFTNDSFRTVIPIVQGSQKARAVNIIALADELIIPMDSPLEQNYIQMYNIETGMMESTAAIPGSAFHAIETDGIMLITTVTEPSKVNKAKMATVWGSLDGRKWKCVCQLKKDFIPIGLQNIFRYAEIVLTPGKNETPYITAYGRALTQVGDCMLIWEKEKLRHFLNE